MALDIKELEQLQDLKKNHPPYFEAMMNALSVIVPRNKKYTGTHRDKDLFANFTLTAKILGVTPQQIFKNWMAIKLARILLNDKDYDDENFIDSLRDLANYTLLFMGYLHEINDTEFMRFQKALEDVDLPDLYPVYPPGDPRR